MAAAAGSNIVLGPDGSVVYAPAGFYYQAGPTERVIRATQDDQVIRANDLGDEITLLNGPSEAFGGAGNDILTAGTGAQTLQGGAGNDLLVGGDGAETLSGGPGDDTIIVGTGAQSIDGGDGYDTASPQGLAQQYTLEAIPSNFIRYVISDSVALAATLQLSGPETNDGLVNVEAVQFLDGTIQVGSESPAAQVSRLYQALLGRAPDTGGLILWAGLVGAGLPLPALASDILASPEGQARQGALGNAGFVAQVYQASLGRAPDAAGLANWVGQLANGTATRANVAVSVSESIESQTRGGTDLAATQTFVPDEQTASVARLYDTAFGRAPDAAGVGHWIMALKGGPLTAPILSLHDEAVQFIASPEFQARYGTPSDHGFVRLLYQNTLHRMPDPSGAAFWERQLAAGAMDRAGVVLSFSESVEHKAMLSVQIESGGITTKG